jgi:hypothetical protein
MLANGVLARAERNWDLLPTLLAAGMRRCRDIIIQVRVPSLKLKGRVLQQGGLGGCHWMPIGNWEFAVEPICAKKSPQLSKTFG